MRSYPISTWDRTFIMILSTRCIFYTIDLIFTFSPSNQLKQELHNTGRVIFSAALNKLPRDFQRSVKLLFALYLAVSNILDFYVEQVDQFSLCLLHQENRIKASGFFEVDNSFLCSVKLMKRFEMIDNRNNNFNFFKLLVRSRLSVQYFHMSCSLYNLKARLNHRNKYY